MQDLGIHIVTAVMFVGIFGLSVFFIILNLTKIAFMLSDPIGRLIVKLFLVLTLCLLALFCIISLTISNSVLQ